MARANEKAKNNLKRATQNQMAPKGGNDLRMLIKKMQPEIINACVGTGLEPKRFTRVVLSAISQNERLAECTPESFLAAMMSAAQLGLEPNTSMGYAYLIPYKNQCTFQLGYQGMIQLAKRSKLQVTARIVYENDEFHYEYGWDDDLRHVPAKGERGEPVYYYAKYKDKDGFGDFVVLSKEDVVRHAEKFSQSFSARTSPWQTDFDSMALKTAIKQVLKYAPLSVEAREAVNSDEGFKRLDVSKSQDINILEVPAEFEVEDIEEEPKGATVQNAAIETDFEKAMADDYIPFPEDGQETVFNK